MKSNNPQTQHPLFWVKFEPQYNIKHTSGDHQRLPGLLV